MSAERIDAENKELNYKLKVLNRIKTNLLKVAFVAAIALVSGLNVFNAQKSDLLSDIALANVEALADDENPGSHNHGPTKKPLLGSKYCKNENNIN